MAQTPAAGTGTAYTVTYIEVTPASADAARKHLRTYSTSTAKADGLVQFQAYQRVGTKHHFAIVEGWKTSAARDAHTAAAPSTTYRAALEPMLIAPYDERPYVALTTGPAPKSGSGTVHAVTHVDIIPPRKDEGVALTKKLGEESRATPGNLRFDVLTQTNRPNHMTVVESWKNPAAQVAHTAAAHTVAYRKALLPMNGSLYDERLYTGID
jgi:quinol monooxygenase YgiN